MTPTPPLTPNFVQGRGPVVTPANRFDRIHVETDTDWLNALAAEGETAPSPRTQFFIDGSESILNYYPSPDVGPGWGLNPYRGCEHVIFHNAYVFTAWLFVGSDRIQR